MLRSATSKSSTSASMPGVGPVGGLGSGQGEEAISALDGQQSVPNLGLHSAAATGNIGLVKYALENGQPVSSLLNGLLPLHAASAGGNETVVRFLLSYGADVNAVRERSQRGSSSQPGMGAEGSTSLHFAAAEGHLGVIRLLLDRGARPAEQDRNGVTPEMLAADNGHAACASLLRSWQAAYGPNGLADVLAGASAGSSSFAGAATPPTLGLDGASSNGRKESQAVRSQRSFDHLSLAAAGVKASLLARKNHALAKVSSNPNLKSAAATTSPPTPPPPLPTPPLEATRRQGQAPSFAQMPSPEEGANATALHFLAPHNKRRPSLPSIFERATHPTASLRAALGGSSSSSLRTEVDADAGSAGPATEADPLGYNVNMTTPPSPLRHNILGSKRSFSNIVRKATGGASSHNSSTVELPSSTPKTTPESSRLLRSRPSEASLASETGAFSRRNGGGSSSRSAQADSASLFDSSSSTPPPPLPPDRAFGSPSARAAAELASIASPSRSSRPSPPLSQHVVASPPQMRRDLDSDDSRGSARQRSRTTSCAGQEMLRVATDPPTRTEGVPSRSHSSDGGEDGAFEDAQEFLGTPISGDVEAGRFTSTRRTPDGGVRQIAQRSSSRVTSPRVTTDSLPFSSQETTISSGPSIECGVGDDGAFPHQTLHKPRSMGSISTHTRSPNARSQSQQTSLPTRTSRAGSMASKASSSSLVSHTASDHAQAILRSADQYAADGKMHNEDGTQVSLTQMLAAYGEALALERGTASSVSSSGHSVTMSPLRKQASIASLGSRGVPLRSVQEDEDRPPMPSSNPPTYPRSLSESTANGLSAVHLQPSKSVNPRARARSIEAGDAAHATSSTSGARARNKVPQMTLREIFSADDTPPMRAPTLEGPHNVVEEYGLTHLVKKPSNSAIKARGTTDDSMWDEPSSAKGLLSRGLSDPNSRFNRSDHSVQAPTSVGTSPYNSPSTPVSPASAYFGESSTSTSTSATTAGAPAPVHKHSPSLPTDLGTFSRDSNFAQGSNLEPRVWGSRVHHTAVSPATHATKDGSTISDRRMKHSRRPPTAESQSSEEQHVTSAGKPNSMSGKAARSFTDLTMPLNAAARGTQQRPAEQMDSRQQSSTSLATSSTASTSACGSSSSSHYSSGPLSTARPSATNSPFQPLPPVAAASTPTSTTFPRTSSSPPAPKKKSTMKAFLSGIRQNVSK